MRFVIIPSNGLRWKMKTKVNRGFHGFLPSLLLQDSRKCSDWQSRSALRDRERAKDRDERAQIPKLHTFSFFSCWRSRWPRASWSTRAASCSADLSIDLQYPNNSEQQCNGTLPLPRIHTNRNAVTIELNYQKTDESIHRKTNHNLTICNRRKHKNKM